MSSPAVAAFEAAFRERDFSHATAHLADAVVFHSPVLVEPWRTKPVLERLGPAMVSIFDEFELRPALSDDDRAVALFGARLGETDVEGALALELGPDGLVREFSILIRPLPALKAVARAMGAA